MQKFAVADGRGSIYNKWEDADNGGEGMETRVTTPREALERMRPILAGGGSFRLVVTGVSMLPLLRHGSDAVILSPLRREAKKGDILFYLRGPEVCVLHRVYKVEGDILWMCGDAQLQWEPIRREQVLAVVSRIERGKRRWNAEDFSWRALSRLWMLARPIRTYLLAAWKKLTGYRPKDDLPL